MTRLEAMFTVAFTVLLFVVVHGSIPFYDRYCVSGSIIPGKTEGTYEYAYVNQTTNASVYYNQQTDRYLFQWIVNDSGRITKEYLIGSNPQEFVANTYCIIDDLPPLGEALSPIYCTKGWVSYDNKWIDDTNMRLSECDDICITGQSKPYLHGTYIWSHFDLTRNATVYTNAINSDLSLSASNATFDIYNTSSALPPNTSAKLVIETCSSSCDNGIQTPYYGTMKPRKERTMFNQGRIGAILSWAVYNDNTFSIYQSIGNFQYRSNSQQVSDVLGSGGTDNDTHFDPCPSFVLDADDYIHGYRVIYDEYVFGLTFYTLNGKMYNCNASDLDYSQYYDSGVIYDSEYYLSGFSIYVEWIFDAIAFQFSAVDNCTLSPTTDPTTYTSTNPAKDPTANPSIFPSIHPTDTPPYSTDLPSRYPSVAPTTYPTSYPSIYPSINPSTQPILDPTALPTLDPTSLPTVDPTSLPTLDPTSLPTSKPNAKPSQSDEHVYDSTMNTYTIIVRASEDEVLSTTVDTSDPFIILMLCGVGILMMLVSFAIFRGKCKNDNELEKDDNDNVAASADTWQKETNDETQTHIKTPSVLLNDIWNSFTSSAVTDGMTTTTV